MNRLLLGTISILLMLGMLTLAFNVQPVRAYGPVYIMSDGSVSPSSAPIYRNGDIYTLTADISTDTDGIWIQKSNVVLDGSGHTLGGSGASNSAGIWGDWGYGSNVIINNLKMRGYTYGIGFAKSANCTVENCEVTDCLKGVMFVNSLNCVVSRNNLTGCDIYLWNCTFCSVSGNIVRNCSDGIMIAGACSNNIIDRNTISECNRWYGIMVQSGSSNNSITDNTLTGSGGISFRDSSGNKVYYNNFTSIIQAESINAINTWDDGYPSGGNYWSDYIGTDSNHDGIGDSNYTINANNNDRYPLMGKFSDFNATSEHHVQTVCNSTISDFRFNGTAICFNVSGRNGTTGFCRICIPRVLMNSTYEVFVNGTKVQCNELICSNGTHAYLYFNYTHSTIEVIIIPEFPSFLIPSLFMIATLLAVIIYRRKHQRDFLISISK